MADFEIVFKLDDVRPFIDKLKGLEHNLLPGAMMAAILEIGLFIEREAKIRAPVDTGRLRSSIGSGPEGIFKTHKGYKVWKVTVGTNVEYAPYQEFGFTMSEGRVVNIPGVGFRYVSPFTYPGQHFMRDAMKAADRAIASIVEKHLSRAIREAGF